MATLKPSLALVAMLAFLVMHALCVVEVSFLTRASECLQISTLDIISKKRDAARLNRHSMFPL